MYACGYLCKYVCVYVCEILVTKCRTSVYQFHQTFQVSVYKYAKWVRTDVFEIKMHIQLGHIDKNEAHDS